MDIIKTQSPLTLGEKGIYPLTTADQVVLADGTRLEKNGKIYVDEAVNAQHAINATNAENAVNATNAENATDSSKLGGVDASEFLQKNQVVNNLTTEEEGFIADARALMDLKTLFDGLHLSVETRNTTNVKSITVPYPSGSADEGCVVFVNVKDWSTQTTNFGIGCIYNKSGVNGKVIVNTSLISSLTTDGTNITVNLSGANSYVRATAIMFS